MLIDFARVDSIMHAHRKHTPLVFIFSHNDHTTRLKLMSTWTSPAARSDLDPIRYVVAPLLCEPRSHT